MTKETHTPGPWGLMAGMPTNVLAASGIRVARCDFDGDFSHPETRANAEMIVRAVNSHDELVAALKRLSKQMLGRVMSQEDIDALDEAGRVISKARGQ